MSDQQSNNTYVSLVRPLGPHLGTGENTLKLGKLVLAFLDNDVHHGLEEGFLLLQVDKTKPIASKSNILTSE